MKSDALAFESIYSHEELRERFSLASAQRGFVRQFRGKASRYAVAILLKHCLTFGHLPRTLQPVLVFPPSKS